jgi:hypothetical protein
MANNLRELIIETEQEHGKQFGDIIRCNPTVNGDMLFSGFASVAVEERAPYSFRVPTYSMSFRQRLSWLLWGK